jgi:hypothetical protein
MISPIDHYFLQQPEPNKSCLLFLRKFILAQNEFITEKWSYGMPLYCYKGKRICYLWIDKKLDQPYILLVDGNKIDHPDLIQDDRKRMKIFLVDAKKDINKKKLKEIFSLTMNLIDRQ